MAGVNAANSCKCVFKRLEISVLVHEYIFPLMNFTVNDHMTKTISTIHTANLRNKNQVHRNTADLSRI
jgi:hypothetical protein